MMPSNNKIKQSSRNLRGVKTGGQTVIVGNLKDNQVLGNSLDISIQKENERQLRFSVMNKLGGGVSFK